ncbi:MAG: hypothetical protein GQ532_14945 [Methylomarinum sp.]|nr:hypothetical protein [Methylomarinum sp.]
MAAKYTVHSSPVVLLNAGLNSGTFDDGDNIVSIAISNDGAAERDFFMKLRLSIAASSARTGSSIKAYLIPEVNGVYRTGSVTVDPLKGFIGTFEFTQDTAAGVDIIDKISIPNCDFKILLINEIGVTLAATGNELEYEIDSYEDV